MSWKYCVMRNITPYSARNTRIIPEVPTENAEFRKNCMSSIGTSTCSSQTTNRASTTPDTANDRRTPRLVQPVSGAWMRPYTNDEMPTMDSSAPAGSSFACLGSLDVGTKNQPATSASVTIGTFTKN